MNRIPVKVEKRSDSLSPGISYKEYKFLLETYPAFNRLISQILHYQKYTLILGNGCSMSCGVPSYEILRKKLISLLSGKSWQKHDFSRPLEVEKFEKLWRQSGYSLRKKAMDELIPKRPMHLNGYYLLAKAIQDKIFDSILTYNYDTYLETALHSIGNDDFICLINKCHDIEYIHDAADRKDVAIIYKIHGDAMSGLYAMTSDEIILYNMNITGVVQSLTKNKLIILGYSASDYPFMREFDMSTIGEDIWYVNPKEPPEYLKQIMKMRDSEENHLQMEFNVFADCLYYAKKKASPKKKVIKLRGSNRRSNYFKIKLHNKLGLHAGAASKLVELCRRYQSQVTVCKEHDCVDAKSILSLLLIAASYGEEIEFRVEGPDQNECVNAIIALITNKFAEE